MNELLERLTKNEERFINFFYNNLKNYMMSTEYKPPYNFFLCSSVPKNDLKSLGNKEYREKTYKSLKNKKYIYHFWERGENDKGIKTVQLAFDQDKFIEYYETYLQG